MMSPAISLTRPVRGPPFLVSRSSDFIFLSCLVVCFALGLDGLLLWSGYIFVSVQEEEHTPYLPLFPARVSYYFANLFRLLLSLSLSILNGARKF